MKMEDPLARLGNLAPLIERHAPYLHLHPAEVYRTGAFEDYLADPAMHYGPPRNKHPVPDPLPLGDISRGGYLYYDWHNPRIRKGDLDRTRVYIHALEHQVWGEDEPPGIALQFWFWYPFNGSGSGRVSLRLRLSLPEKIKLNWPPWKTRIEDKVVLDHSFSGTVGLDPFGAHEGDWEQATLFFDQDQTLKMIRCKQNDHYTDYAPGEWQERNGRPVLYSALNSHATFASAGEYPTRRKSSGAMKPVSAAQSAAFDVKMAKVRADVKLGLINACRPGPSLDCALCGRVVAVSATVKDGPLKGFQGPPAPAWLGFQGRAGDAEPTVGETSNRVLAEFERSFTDTFLDSVDHVLPGAVRMLAIGIAKDIVSGVANRVAPLILREIGKVAKLGQSAPRMPAGKTDWSPAWQAK